MPRTRPREISNGVSLSDKLGREDRAFVAEHGAVDAMLFWLGIIDEPPPNKEGVGIERPQDDMLAGADKLAGLACLAGGAVVPLVEFEAGRVAIFREIPVGHITPLLQKRLTREPARPLAGWTRRAKARRGTRLPKKSGHHVPPKTNPPKEQPQQPIR